MKKAQNFEFAYHVLTHETRIQWVFIKDYQSMIADKLEFQLRHNIFKYEDRREPEELDRNIQIIVNDFIDGFNEIIKGKDHLKDYPAFQ